MVYGYSIRRGVITWAANNGAPLLLQIFGRWGSDSYKRYITYFKRDLTQLSYYASGLMRFKDSRLVQQYLNNPTGDQLFFHWQR